MPSSVSAAAAAMIAHMEAVMEAIGRPVTITEEPTCVVSTRYSPSRGR